ncbi:MAG: hypothetical protein LBJ00_01405 [Planctomycetaceae bacterium]|nr:hypothetical protein [Planctomycetaceae bacterium]
MKSKIVIGLSVLASFAVCAIIIYAQSTNNSYQQLPQKTQNVEVESCGDPCCGECQKH